MALLNSAGGVAPRNGTNSHTVSFGFTSTSGSFLVFVAAVSDTNAASGWTSRATIAQFATLTVFSKTSVGDSSITVTHSTNDYPMNWWVEEWPAGTTWVNGVTASATNVTMPTLTGLPGTAVRVNSAICRNCSGTSGTCDATAWTGTTVEDRDNLVLRIGTGTEGIYFTVAHENGVTATSLLPTVTVTPSGGSVFSGSAQYQKIVWAVAEPSALTLTFEAATPTKHAGADLTLSGAGAAAVGFDAAATEHAGADPVVTGAGAATITFDAAGSDHGAADLTLTPAGAAAIGFDAAASQHLGTDFAVNSPAPGAVTFQTATSTHAAANITVTGAGAATITFDAAGSAHAAADVTVTGAGGAAVTFEAAGSLHGAADFVAGASGEFVAFDAATTFHAAADLTLTGAGAGVLVFEAATSLHGAANMTVTVAIPTPGENIDRVRACEHHNVAACEDHRVGVGGR